MGRLQMVSFHYRREKDGKIERLSFTFTPNGKREFVPRDQVYPLIVLNYLLLQLKKISSFTPVSYIRIVLESFICYFPIYSEKFST